MPTPQQIAKVRDALENSSYVWHTISAIVKETQLSADIVQAALQALGSDVIQSEIPSDEGEDLFATRSHYRNKTSWFRRFLAALKNQAT